MKLNIEVDDKLFCEVAQEHLELGPEILAIAVLTCFNHSPDDILAILLGTLNRHPAADVIKAAKQMRKR